MARSIILGNGSLLVGLDERGLVRDFHYPRVGLENHVGGQLMHKIGVYVDGVLSWIDADGWNVAIAYTKESMCSNITAVNERIGVELRFSDVVYNESNLFIRLVHIINKRDEKREIKIFFNQQFHISELSRGDTAYFSPDVHACIHYKGRRVFLVSGKADGKFFDMYSVGLLGIEGKEGTWADAQDGELSKNPIEHGSVDSVIGFSLFFNGNEEKEITYWIAAGKKYKDVMALHKDINTRGAHHLHKTTTDFWHAWVSERDISYCGLGEDVIDLFKQSLFVMRAHTDNGGGIIASSDSSILQYGRDTYNYVWPRDGSYIASAFLRAGYTDLSERFYAFCNDIITEDGYLLHKYRSDRSLGSSWEPWIQEGRPQLPIQEDETAVVLTTLWEHYDRTKDLEFIESIYNSFIKNAADFLCDYRDKKTGLPKPSFDLWEERYGVFTYTAASVYGGLMAASRFAAMLGKETPARKWHTTAEEVRSGILAYLYDKQGGQFFKSLHIDDKGEIIQDRTFDASSVYGIFRFKVLDAHDVHLARAVDLTLEHLTIHTDVTGIARYEGDQYYRVNANVPGNAWFIPTFWYIQYTIARAEKSNDLDSVRDAFSKIKRFATFAGMFSEQLDPLSGAPLSVSPLVWSHAEFVRLVLDYVERLQALGLCSIPKSS